MLRFRKDPGLVTQDVHRRPADDCEVSSRTALANAKADRLAKARKAVPVDRDVLASYAGGCRLPHRMITVSEEGGRSVDRRPPGRPVGAVR
ncbi:hypothetical protein ACFPOA_08350 [Lysobacter niabensis]|uniref:hypothetical protein n=1 Tax=Agrilutibacter niabensis TaxID=380628 RepID=UPI00362373C9